MKFKSWKRVFSGILAAVTVISSCTAGPVMAASEETETGYPTLQEVIDQLDEDEIVNAKMTQNEAKYPVEKARGSAAKYDQF